MHWCWNVPMVFLCNGGIVNSTCDTIWCVPYHKMFSHNSNILYNLRSNMNGPCLHSLYRKLLHEFVQILWITRWLELVGQNHALYASIQWDLDIWTYDPNPFLTMHQCSTFGKTVSRSTQDTSTLMPAYLHSLLNYHTPPTHTLSTLCKHQPVVCSSRSHYLCLPWF